MSKLFKHHKVRRNFIIVLLFILFTNIFSLIVWYEVKIKSQIQNIESTREIVMTERLNDNYLSLAELEKNLDSLSDEYDIVFRVVDEDNHIVKDINLEKSSMQLFSVFIKVADHLYLIDAYFASNISLVNLILSLNVFQIFVILILVISAYFFIGHSIITPIENIINDIRNYKFGKKPIRKEINNELDVIQNEFVNLVDSLEEEKQEQKRIIASISHDIKTPLTSIIGYSSLMEDNLPKKQLKEYSIKVHDKALHIKDILSTFDDYLINYDNKKLKLTVVSIKDMIKELNDDYKIELNNKNIDFNIITDCENEKINIDVLKIKRVFSNIISNSIKYVPKKGIINISIQKRNNFIEFSVSDNGTGVDKESIDKIFDPFFTTDTSRKISGLGLSICKEFIEIHEGTIKALNHNGLTIYFTLPVYIDKNIHR